MTTIFALRKACLALLLFLGASAAGAGHRGVNIIDDGRDPAQCEDITIWMDGRPAMRAQERLRVPAEPGKTLRIRVPENSGTSIRGAERADFEVLACKAAASQQALSRIALSHNGNTVTVNGPAAEFWVGYLLILAPKDASLDVEAVHGGIRLGGLAGRVTARSENGPISIRGSGGEIDAKAQNGPIDFVGDGGQMRLRTENGPIGVSLSGTAWSGAGLEARAVNGPVRLRIPANYRTAALVESTGHSPMSCRAEACADARRTWDDEHKRLEFGEGPALVRLSTENGPVSVTSSRGDVEDED